MQADPDHIACWQRLSDTITTSGHIEPAGVAALAALGVRHVINLAMPDHPQVMPDAAERLAAHGIGHTHIPIPFDAPRNEHFAAFCDALATTPRPLHVHCILNWRVSACFYRWHREIRGMDEGAARVLMAQQWQPEITDYPGAEAWARFIAGNADQPAG
ncbi:hypothetical protein C0V78_14395 [Novosphingobium sp. TH158]|nr:hypothetical protein C0V78_14395 [Novosphingobium sp. TH158]